MFRGPLIIVFNKLQSVISSSLKLSLPRAHSLIGKMILQKSDIFYALRNSSDKEKMFIIQMFQSSQVDCDETILQNILANNMEWPSFIFFFLKIKLPRLLLLGVCNGTVHSENLSRIM